MEAHEHNIIPDHPNPDNITPKAPRDTSVAPAGSADPDNAHGPDESWLVSPRGALPEAKEWAVAHVHARAEKALARCLYSWGVPFYVPLLRMRRAYGARKRAVYLPLFSGYVFYDRLTVERQVLLETNKVAKILVAPDPEQLRAELSNLFMALTMDTELREIRFGDPGSRVNVARGPLKGLEGILVRYQGKQRLVLQVQMIGRALYTDVDISMCEPLP